MDAKDIRNLSEAYMEVYAPQEEIEEGLRSAVKRLLSGGKKEVEASKPESRGEQLRKKYNVGPEKSDTSAKRQILNRSRARAERDEKDYGSSKYSKSVAQKSKAAHERYLKAGYSKYGADDARGSGNKARKRAAALNREEFEFIVNVLVEEGYDLSSYTWDEMYEICLDEAVKGADSEMRKVASSERRGGDKRLPPSKGKGYAAHAMQQAAYMDKKTKGKHIPGYAFPEEVDVYDIILSHLLDEGYAETVEAAEVIMVNMSEDWRESIVEAVSGGSYYDLPGVVIRAASGAASKLLNRGQPPAAKPKPHPSDSKLVDVSTADKAAKNLPGSRVYNQRQQQQSR